MTKYQPNSHKTSDRKDEYPTRIRELYPLIDCDYLAINILEIVVLQGPSSKEYQ